MPWLIKNDDVLQLEPKSHRWWQRKKDSAAAAATAAAAAATTTTTVDVTNPPSSSSSSSPSSSSSSSLFFVHVPRCGGTSLMHYYELPRKIYTYYQYNIWKRLGMYAFFSRYKTLEQYNFPVWTSGNAFAVMITIVGIYFMIDTKNNYIPYNLGVLLIFFGITLFILLTIVFTAPVIGRFSFIHHAYLLFVHYVLCQFMECTPYCTGTNKTGYIMHLTAHKLLYTYQYVTIPQWNIACSMAIIRNPYSRMISIYTYNRFGEWESFTHFVNDWYHNVCRYYRTNRICDEWYTPCHAIPQFEYTHYQGKPLVKSIIKQEELKYLKDVYRTHLTPNQPLATSTIKTKLTPSTTQLNNAYNNVNRESDSEESSNHDNDKNHHGNVVVVDDDHPTDHPNPPHNDHRMIMMASGEDTAETRPTLADGVTTTTDMTESVHISSSKSASIQNLPDTVRDALIHMPHSNQRLLSKGKWYDYYTQHTLNLVYEIYYEDFNYFHYNPILVQRPDLQPPHLYHELYHPRTDPDSTTATTTTNITQENDIELGHLSTPPPNHNNPTGL
jgi:hypothetical protein